MSIKAFLVVVGLFGQPGTLDELDFDANPCPRTLTRAIPPRAADALTGSEFMTSIWHLDGRAREDAIIDQVLSGNVPEFLRHLIPVRLNIDDARRGRHEAILCVMPDYLAVGSDDDFVRMPMGFPAATRIAREFNFTLPTRKIVDAIYRQSTVRLSPRPMKPGPDMVSTAYFAAHNATIEQQRAGRGNGELMSGHKKDLILTKRLLTRRGRVAIYGWHQKRGRPIQPLSTVHGARYADYSHGVRLVSTTVLYDDVPAGVYDLLGEPKTAPIMTHEGTIKDAAKIMGLTERKPATSDSQ